ncbi:MAG: hypothetical protein LBS56_04160, partial [Propionibacteriaceae bacterium]|nr:hypothetical protein [Propionibacteriaceae bacterium]
LDWDRAADRIRGRKGAQRLAVTSGGTIPDRGLYAVFAEGEGAGRRVGELDEEMVFESRVGDTITLGSSSWLITAITADQVHVVAAPGAPARLPFWKGDGLGRTAELGEAIGVFVRELADGPDPRDRLAALGLDEWARDNLMAYVEDQRAATGVVPDDKTIVVESFRDELGDWRVVVLSPWGHRVHLPWSLLIAARFAEAHGVGIQAMPTDDGIGFRLPDTAQEGDVDASAWAREGLGANLVVDPDHVEGLVRAELAHSTHFAARFREAAARALLLPRRQPGRRQPLWQLRNRSAQLLQVAARYPEFPIMAEAARECLHDDFDLGALAELMARIGRREVRVVEVTTPRPSPFARTVLFNYVGLFMYEADTPLAELRAAALTVDPALLSDLLGGGAGLALADLLDAEVVALVERELQCLTESRWARDPEDVHDLVRRLGPITTRDLQERTRPEVRSRVGEWLDALARDHQIESFAGHELSSARAGGSETEDKWGVAGDVDVDSFPGGELPSARAGRSGTEDRWSVAGDVDADSFPGGELRSARAGWSGAEKRWIVAGEGDVAASTLILRYARTHGPFALAEVEAWLLGGSSVGGSPLDTAGWIVPLAAALVADGRLVEGKLRPGAPGVTVHCDPGVLARLRRRSLTKLRAEVRPVEQAAYARFLPRWQGVGDRSRRGLDGLSRTVEQLAGVAVPASALETFVLPARVADYRVGLLDELLSTGEVVWAGRGELAGGDGWVTLSPAELVDAFPAEPALELGELDDRVWRAVAGGGAYRLAEVVAAMAAQATVPVARDEVDARGAVPPGRDALDARVAVPRGRDALDARGAASVVRDAGDSRGTAPAAADVLDALWRLAWAGLVTTDTFAPLRERLAGVRPTTRARPPTPRSRLGRPRLGLARPARLGQADLGGRWFALPTPPTGERAEAQRAVARAEVLLDRHGVVT